MEGDLNHNFPWRHSAPPLHPEEPNRVYIFVPFEEDFNQQILPFDKIAVKFHASITSSSKNSGKPISKFDAQIAAIAKSRELVSAQEMKRIL